jgi:hypothetical protein
MRFLGVGELVRFRPEIRDIGSAGTVRSPQRSVGCGLEDDVVAAVHQPIERALREHGVGKESVPVAGCALPVTGMLPDRNLAQISS